MFSRWLRTGSSNMAVMEVTLMTGYKVDVMSLERLVHTGLKRYEIKNNQVMFYFDEVSDRSIF